MVVMHQNKEGSESDGAASKTDLWGGEENDEAYEVKLMKLTVPINLHGDNGVRPSVFGKILSNDCFSKSSLIFAIYVCDVVRSGQDPHVAGPKTHAMCGTPYPLYQPPFSY